MGSSLQSRLVGRDVVHALNDVDLTAVGPVRLVGLPDSGPGAASLRHVVDVEHRDVRRVRGDRFDAHAVATGSRARGQGGGAVRAHLECGGRGRHKSSGLRRSRVDVGAAITH